MSAAPLQVLLKWPEHHHGREYWYVIRRGLLGAGFFIEGYFDKQTGKTVVPQFSFPLSQDDVAEAFAAQGISWRREPSG